MPALTDRIVALFRDAYRPDAFWKGVTVGLLSAVPFILCLLLDQRLLAIFSSLAAVRLGMADPGGAFPYRLRTMCAGLVCVTLGCLVGTALANLGTGPGPGMALVVVPVMLVVFAFAYLGALGPEGLAVSVLTLFLLVVSLGVPGDPLLRAGGVFLAGLFMILCLLAPWPFLPDRPARRSMAVALASVAALAEAVCRSEPESEAEDARARWTARTRAYRDLDLALDALAESLSPRAAGRGVQPLRQLRDAAGAARRMTRALTSLAEYRSRLPDWLLAELAAEAAALRDAARELPRLSLRAGRGLALDLGPPGGAAAMPAPDPELPAPLRGALEDFREAAAQVRRALSGPAAAAEGGGVDRLLPAPGRPALLFRWAWPRLRGSFTFQSTAFRHALRQAGLIAAGSALVWQLQLPFGYWVMLTIVMVAKPAYGGTRKAVGARIVGTLIGAALAEAVLLGTNDFWVLAALALLFNCLSHAFITVNYALGVTILTPYVILKIAAALPDTDVTVPRLTATMIGAALIAGSLLIWPPVRYRSYWSAVGGSLQNMQAAIAELGRRLAAGLPPPPVAEPVLVAARRGSRMNLQNAEAVVAEILLEPPDWHPNRRELRSVVEDLHRLSGALAALADPQHELVPVAQALLRCAELMQEMARACTALDAPGESRPEFWPADMPQQVRQATAPLDRLGDEALRRFAAALRDLSEDLATLQRLRVAPVPPPALRGLPDRSRRPARGANRGT